MLTKILTLALTTTFIASSAHAGAALTLLPKEKGTPINVIEVNKEAIRNKTQAFKPVKLVTTSAKTPKNRKK